MSYIRKLAEKRATAAASPPTTDVVSPPGSIVREVAAVYARALPRCTLADMARVRTEQPQVWQAFKVAEAEVDEAGRTFFAAPSTVARIAINTALIGLEGRLLHLAHAIAAPAPSTGGSP